MIINPVLATLRLNLLALTQIDLGLKIRHVRCTFVSSAYILGEPKLNQFVE